MLNCTTTKEEFAAGLAQARLGAAQRSTLDVLKAVHVEATGDALLLTGFDLDLMVRVRVRADVKSPGVMLPAAGLLSSVVREMPARESMVVRATEGYGVVEAGRATVRVATMPAAEWPITPPVEYVGDGVRWSELGDALKRVSWATSTEPSRPILNGVSWKSIPGGLQLAAANGPSLAREFVNIEGTPDGEFIVPPRACDAFHKVFESDDIVRFGFDAARSHIGLRSVDTDAEVCARLTEGPYPPIERVIPASSPRVAIVPVATLVAALRRVATVRNEKSSLISLAWGGDTVHLSAESTDKGKATDVAPVDSFEGDPFTLGFNVTFLLELLANVPSSLVRIGMGDATRAITLEPVDSSARWLGIGCPARDMRGDK